MIKLFWFIKTLIYKPFLGKLGSLSYLGKPIYVKNWNRIFIGNKVRIYPHSRLEAFDKNSAIIFEDHVSIGQNLHIVSKGSIVIKNNTTISANVLITNIDHEYKELNKHIMCQPLIEKQTIIGENCFIGYGAVIQAGSKIGRQCIIGSNSVVKGTFPDYCVIAGAPAKIIRKYNTKTQQWDKYRGTEQ
jgi:acetyltransferase-like isoleucine patch superfamily enzyme